MKQPGLPNRGLYAITDYENNSHLEILEKSEKILDAGAVMLQYRNKSAEFENKKKLAQELKSICNYFNAIFIINDDIELARLVNADGIHLGKEDERITTAREYLGNIIIGISCYNNIDNAIKAEKEGANYVAFGSFFHSYTKPEAGKANIDILYEAKSRVKLPIVAIGGITPENGKILIEAGADFLAVINGLYSTANTYDITKIYLDLFNK